ncbi:MAG: hypothetical protein KF678_12465 [Phycisphaeraceae bacterium]|nr:hypothetical protein [Phycisphaeraceae bacterium]
MNRLSFALSLVLAAGTSVHAQPAEPVEAPMQYRGHRAVRVEARTARELQVIRALADEVLTCSGTGIGRFDIRVTPPKYAALVAEGIRHEVLIPDIQAHMDQIWADDARVRAGDDPSWFATYRTLTEFETRMQYYATNYPNLATLSNIGTSIQGRQIKMLRITGPGSTETRPAFIVQANQHAREWVTPHAAMYMVDRFCETYGTDPRITNVVNNIDFHFIVTVNPDGYAYSNPSNPSWRKNRRANSNNPATGCSTTFGVDLNRNWGYQWGYDNTGSSGTCSSETYRGVAAWSEPELAGVKSLVDSLAAQGRLKVHWDIHANGQSILSPWGFRTTPAPPDLPLMNTLGQMIQTGMASVRGTNYPYGQGSVILYLNNGNTRDYTYGVHGAMAWTIELGGSSFQPAVSQILPLCQEALEGLLPVAEYYIPPAPPPCYANCDGSTGSPRLTSNDFQCFLNRFASGDTYANCDGSNGVPMLTSNDFQCFLNKFASGCT